MNRILFSVAILSIALAGGAQAQTTGTATTDLNIRSGPGPEQPAIGYMKSRQKAQILGCIEGSLWCQIEFKGQQGWAYSQYMSLKAGGGRIVVREPAHVATIPVVTYDATTYAAATYRPDIPPAFAPLPGNAVVGAGGAGAGAIGAPKPVVYASTFTPPPAVGSYLTSNEATSFTYPGEVVVGASLPQSAVLNNVPDYRYQYVYLNDKPVLIDPFTRRIVYVFR